MWHIWTQGGRISLFLTVLIASSTLLSLPPTYAQRHSGAVGVGLQVGQPSGAAVKLYRSGPVAYDGLLTTDGDDFIHFYLHHLWEQPFPDSPLHIYVGPGLMMGSEQLDTSPVLRLGMSASVGLNFYAERFEIFMQVTPNLHFLPRTTTQLGGSVGLRYYLLRP